MRIATVIQMTKAHEARISVGSAARVMRVMTSSPVEIENPKSPWRTPFDAPLIAVGRKFGQLVGPRNIANPSLSGLQMPIQRQYWIGIGWSRPHALRNSSRCCWVILGLLANLAVGPPGAASRML